MDTNLIKISDQIAITLKQMGVKHAFGIIGAGNVNLFDSINKLGYTEIVCVHHEQAATMAMQTYYRVDGKLPVVLLTTGAGSTNGVTGVMSAWADSIPGIIISGNENGKFCTDDNPLRMWGVQGYDSVQMVNKITKYASRVSDPVDVVFEMHKAREIALNGRPGPVWLDIPMSVQSSRVNYNEMKRIKQSSTHQISPLEDQIQNVFKSLQCAERPVLWLGNGIRLAGATNELKSLIDELRIPAIVSWAGIDMIDSSHPLVIGRAGVYGQRCANFVLQNSDYILTIGTRMAIPQIGYEISELARNAKIDVVDIDETEGQKHIERIRSFIHADAKCFIEELRNKDLKAIESKNRWLKKCKSYQKDYPWVGNEHVDQDNYMNSYRFMECINKFFKKDQIVVTDMGTALLSGHQVLKFKEGQRLMTSTGLGEMGFGLPAAIGASFAKNKCEVMCLNCDGGIMMNIQELQTIAHHKLPIKIFIFNNDGYLMIKHTQKAMFKGSDYVGTNSSSGISCPDFGKIAAGFDIPAYKIDTWDTCESILKEVQSVIGPVICEVLMHPEQPFVPKLSLTTTKDGDLVSPPLEDL
jgi:acetolactate synthase I/II/III large subunit